MTINPNTNGRRNGRTIRAALSLALVGAVGVGAGTISASDIDPNDVPVEWPDPVKQRVDRAAFFCTDTAAAVAAGLNLVSGSGVIFGTMLDDLIIGSPLQDSINAGPGNDVVCADDANDRVRGGPGDDVLFGEGGDDRLAGQAGDDILIGGAGVDACNGGAGFDFLDC